MTTDAFWSLLGGAGAGFVGISFAAMALAFQSPLASSNLDFVKRWKLGARLLPVVLSPVLLAMAANLAVFLLSLAVLISDRSIQRSLAVLILLLSAAACFIAFSAARTVPDASHRKFVSEGLFVFAGGAVLSLLLILTDVRQHMHATAVIAPTVLCFGALLSVLASATFDQDVVFIRTSGFDATLKQAQSNLTDRLKDHNQHFNSFYEEARRSDAVSSSTLQEWTREHDEIIATARVLSSWSPPNKAISLWSVIELERDALATVRRMDILEQGMKDTNAK
jgi:hypothetical protein